MGFVRVWSGNSSIASVSSRHVAGERQEKERGVRAVLLSRSNVLLPNELSRQRRLDPVRAYRGRRNTSAMFLLLTAREVAALVPNPKS